MLPQSMREATGGVSPLGLPLAAIPEAPARLLSGLLPLILGARTLSAGS
jgi:hypothetical protein